MGGIGESPSLSHAPPLPRMVRPCAHARRQRPVRVVAVEKAADDASWTRARVVTGESFRSLRPKLARKPPPLRTAAPTAAAAADASTAPVTSNTASARMPSKPQSRRADHALRARTLLRQAMTTAPTTAEADATLSRSAARAAGGRLVAVRFKWTAGAERAVAVSGSFNGWVPIPLHLDAQDDSDCWSRVVRLPIGTHTYRFSVDGRWVVDGSRRVVTLPGRGKLNELRVRPTSH